MPDETVAVVANYAVWGMRRGDRAVLRRTRAVEAMIADGRLLVRDVDQPDQPDDRTLLAMHVDQIAAQSDPGGAVTASDGPGGTEPRDDAPVPPRPRKAAKARKGR